MTKKKIPSPGSREAVDAGCTCPVSDNCHGAGNDMASAMAGKPTFWISGDCPLHGKGIEDDD